MTTVATVATAPDTLAPSIRRISGDEALLAVMQGRPQKEIDDFFVKRFLLRNENVPTDWMSFLERANDLGMPFYLDQLRDSFEVAKAGYPAVRKPLPPGKYDALACYFDAFDVVVGRNLPTEGPFGRTSPNHPALAFARTLYQLEA